jgi:signal transduction histidine kinase
VQKLLALARLEQPEDSDAARPLRSLRNSVEEAVHLSKPLAELKKVKVILDTLEDAPVLIDGHDAALLCSNILINALQHSPEEGEVQIILIQREERIILTVKDWGEGISEEDRPHLFEPFYRGDISRSRKSGGTGLGLSICKAICDRAGGSIEISNHEAGGAVVTVSLPFADRQASSQTRSA